MDNGSAEHTARIANGLLELGPDKIVSTTLYNEQFPGPLLRFKEGRQTTVDIHNDTDTPEQLHWHGQFVPDSVDGAADEGTPFIPARGMRRIAFTLKAAGFRFYHTHTRAGSDLSAPANTAARLVSSTSSRGMNPAPMTRRSSSC